MCGICGLAALDGRAPADPEALRAMNGALEHRGPDSWGSRVDGPVGLAMRRLSIIDLPGGDQPIAGEDGSVVLVCNGEIYNHAGLRADLERRGHRFATRSDVEVIVHLYEERGPDCLSQLRGMFALALWDAASRRLLLARDRFGIKPLYHAEQDGVLSFASELSALTRRPGFDRTLDLDALNAFLALNSIPAPLSVYARAHKLGAGHRLVWEAGGAVRIERWARPRPVAADAIRHEPAGALAAELRERLSDAVRAHLVADVPVGVLLSGGVDSGALTALAARHTAGRLATFSIGFAERSFDELADARRVARRYRTDHHELVLRPDAAELLPRLAQTFDEPFADSSALPTYLVCGLAAEHVKVVLCGEGADELFGGYETYAADQLAALPGVAPLARALRPWVDRLPSSSARVSLDYRAKRFTAAAGLPPLERHHAFKEIFSADARAELLGGGPGSRADPLAAHRARYAETAGAPALARLQDVDTAVYLVDDLLVKTDRASMAHSLEARVPFCDQRVAELAFALPTRHKVRALAKKRLLRAAVAPLLPREVVHGRKRGFSIPAAAWLRSELEPFAREVLSPARTRAQGLLEPAVVTRTLDDHVARRADHSRALWGLISLSLWLEHAAPHGALDAVASSTG
jgi:asparagine synthase (glutamine-hydrolysing)